MKEFVQLLSNEEFKSELEKITQNVENKKRAGYTRYEIICELIRFVKEPTSNIYTPYQLGKIFDLAEDKNERPCETAISGHSTK